MTASARVLLRLPRQLTTPLRLALAPAPSRAPARGYFSFSVLQQPHRCWSRAVAASSVSSSCEQYPRAPIAAAPGAPCPRDGKGEGDGETATGAQQDDSSGAGVPSAPARNDKSEALRTAVVARRKGRSGGAPSRQRGRTAKPQVKKPPRPGPPKQGRGGGGGIIHDVPRPPPRPPRPPPPRQQSASTSTTSPSSSTSSSTRLRVTKKQDREDLK